MLLTPEADWILLFSHPVYTLFVETTITCGSRRLPQGFKPDTSPSQVLCDSFGPVPRWGTADAEIKVQNFFFAENPELPTVPSVNPGVDQDIALHSLYQFQGHKCCVKDSAMRCVSYTISHLVICKRSRIELMKFNLNIFLQWLWSKYRWEVNWDTFRALSNV